MNIVLIGCRCSGKTSVGELLAQRLERVFVDTDGMIEKEAGCSIDQLVRSRGWPRFREMERDVIDRVSAEGDRIIATGGGAVMDERNVSKLKSTGRLVWLRAEPETLTKRMMREVESGRTRPALIQGDPVAEIREILGARHSRYEAASDIVLDTDSLDLYEAAERIADTLLTDRANG
jgi:shikimate kinase